MRAVVVGAGAVGARAARQLHGDADIAELVVLSRGQARRDALVASLGPPARAGDDLAAELRPGDVLVLAGAGRHRPAAELALERGADVVSVSDAWDEARALLALDAEARERGRHVVVGAGFSPGLTCVLAAHAAAGFDRVEEVHVAKAGTGGPSCARQHHRALGATAFDWRDGVWQRRRGGSGRELCWFPDPVGGVDCYRAALPEVLLVGNAFPGVGRVTARVAANRRDRLTLRLPMLRPPHAEGVLGAVRVEVRGRRGASHDERVLGAVDRPAVAAGAVMALAARWAVDGRLTGPGAAGLARLVDPIPFLAALAERGVRAATFEGAAAGVPS